MKIKKIQIENFRHINNLEIVLGDYISVISGLNGTGKSSILGLIGHLFSYRKGSNKKYDFKTLSNKPFETEYSEIFRFCDKHDINKKYKYIGYLENDGGKEIVKIAKTRYIKAENRFRIDVGKRAKQAGKIHHPVIYLGLKRLYPLAQETEEIHISKSDLKSKDRNFFNKEMDEIFVSLDKTINPQHITTYHKDFFGIETSKYGGLGNSAGQDNLGQILTAILSFKNLPKSKGILLIDEIDTALFAGVQINLFKRLYGYARRFNLQIIFTTHSLELLKFIYEKKYDGVTINFLEIRDEYVINSISPDYQYIKYRILRETKEKEFIDKIDILCEDDIAKSWCKNLINRTELKKTVSVHSTNTSNGCLASLAKKNIHCFKKTIFLLDGDSRENYKSNKITYLPEKRPPETIFYNFLSSIPENDSFWGGEKIFYKDTCFSKYPNRSNLIDHKKWLKENKENFGRDYSNLFNKWKKENKVETKKFLEGLENIINKMT